MYQVHHLDSPPYWGRPATPVRPGSCWAGAGSTWVGRRGQRSDTCPRSRPCCSTRRKSTRNWDWSRMSLRGGFQMAFEVNFDRGLQFHDCDNIYDKCYITRISVVLNSRRREWEGDTCPPAATTPGSPLWRRSRPRQRGSSSASCWIGRRRWVQEVKNKNWDLRMTRERMERNREGIAIHDW